MKIANKAKVIMASLAVVMMGLVTALPVSARVVCPNGTVIEDANADLTRCDSLSSNANNKNNLMVTLNTIINVVIGVIGFIAVAVIILGGVQYTTSTGDAAKVTKAKNTIMYGIIGLVVAMLAFAIVNFVLGNVFTTSS